MPPAGFEPTIPASDGPQTHALDRVDSGIGRYTLVSWYLIINTLHKHLKGNLEY